MKKYLLSLRNNREKITIVLTLLSAFSIFLNDNFKSQIDQSSKTVFANIAQSGAVNAAQAVELSRANLTNLQFLQNGCVNCGSSCSEACLILIEDYKNLLVSAEAKNKVAKEIAHRFDDAVKQEKSAYAINWPKIIWLKYVYTFLVMITILVNTIFLGNFNNTDRSKK